MAFIISFITKPIYAEGYAVPVKTAMPAVSG
jgi:hypothetical protein